MKTNDTSNAKLRCQTLNECLRVLPETSPAHSNGKPDVPSTINNIDVRFASHSPLQLQIRHVMKTAPSLNETPFVDLMLHPEKLEAALQAARRENDAFANSRRFSRSDFATTVQSALFGNERVYQPGDRCLAEQTH